MNPINLLFHSGKLWYSEEPPLIREHFHSLALWLNHIKMNWLYTAYEVVNPEVLCGNDGPLYKCISGYQRDIDSESILKDGDSLTLPEGYGIKVRDFEAERDSGGLPVQDQIDLLKPNKNGEWIAPTKIAAIMTPSNPEGANMPAQKEQPRKLIPVLYNGHNEFYYENYLIQNSEELIDYFCRQGFCLAKGESRELNLPELSMVSVGEKAWDIAFVTLPTGEAMYQPDTRTDQKEQETTPKQVPIRDGFSGQIVGYMSNKTEKPDHIAFDAGWEGSADYWKSRYESELASLHQQLQENEKVIDYQMRENKVLGDKLSVVTAELNKAKEENDRLKSVTGFSGETVGNMVFDKETKDFKIVPADAPVETQEDQEQIWIDAFREGFRKDDVFRRGHNLNARKMSREQYQKALSELRESMINKFTITRKP